MFNADGKRRKSVKQFRSAVSAVFGKSGNGNTQMKFVLDNFTNDLHLSFSTIGDDEVGQGRTFFDKACVAASDNFLHGGIIIGSFYGFNIKFAIVLFAGLTHFEYHAGGYGIRALDVGIIKTFDVGGHFLHVELVLYFFQDAYFLLLGIQLVRLFQAVYFILFYIHDG